MNIREKRERIEEETLSPCAALSSRSRGRAVPEPQDPMRTVYCRDRDRIVHCKAFRRLKSKTQVFLSPEGDHYRTRLTHTLEVSQIARSISRALFLNEDLTEAIALGHDLGHTPFGHAGERALDSLVPGGFRHYEQSVRVVSKLEDYPKGLNLTYETIDGILCHTKGREASTFEGRCVRYADHIAYINHDIDDSERAGLLSEDDIPKDIRDVLGSSKRSRITALITDLVENFDPEKGFSYSEEVGGAFEELEKLMFEKIYLNKSGAAKLEERKVSGLIKGLYDGYLENPELLPGFYGDIARKESPERAAADYISGMSDNFAVHCYEEMFVPKSWNYL
ncbi:MAG: deoxyguanosinetriphosphate triphosphohydrolase [Oscillospiraceae bacterium]